jgi:hypothetical protein
LLGDNFLLRGFGLYIVYLYIGWLVGDRLRLLRDFGPYGIIFMNVRVVITVATFIFKGLWAL